MALKTRAQLTTASNLLFDEAQPKVNKANSKTLMADLIESSVNVLSDPTVWMKPVFNMQRVPPGVLVEGRRFVITASPTGAWVGHDWQLAEVVSGAWVFSAIPDRQVFPSQLYPNTYYVREGAMVYARHFDRRSVWRNTGDQSITGTSPQTVTWIEATLLQYKSYDFVARILFSCSDDELGIGFELTGPANTKLAYRAEVVQANGTYLRTDLDDYGTIPASDGVPVPDKIYIAEIRGTMFYATSDGLLMVQVFGSSGTGSITIHRGSSMQVVDITNPEQ